MKVVEVLLHKSPAAAAAAAVEQPADTGVASSSHPAVGKTEWEQGAERHRAVA